MNQMSPFGHEPVVLALEAPFRLAQLHVTPAALELRRGDETWTVEHRVMKVLVALHRSREHAVGREDLIELCWEGRIVGEDSLNRSISQLRKALASEPAVTIDTIPRIGYRLKVEKVGEAALADPPPAPFLPIRRRSWKTAVVAGAALLVGIGGAGLWWSKAGTGEWRASGLHPITRESGEESHPALSPDGQRLIYAAGAGFGAPRDLFLRGIALGDDTPTRITQTSDDEFAPAWSPSGDRIAFIRIDGGGRCALIVMTPPTGAERAVGRCLSPSGLAWLNDGELLFGDRAGAVERRRLFAMEIATGRIRALTNPPPETMGDGAPAVAADGRRIAFRRTAALGSDDLYLLDLRSGAERPITQHGWKASGFAWGEGDTLFFSGNRGGDFGLWSVDVEGGGMPRRISLGTVPFGRISSDLSGRNVAVEAVRRNIRLAVIAPDGTVQPATSGNGNDLDPDVGPAGAIAFVSDRSGTNELWVRQRSGRLIRLTRMNASFVYSPRWSPDGGRIAFLAVVGGRTDIYTVRADGSGLVRVTEDGARKGRVVWMRESSGLLYTVRRAQGWMMMRISATGGPGAAVPRSEGIAIIERNGDRLFGRTTGAQTLVALDAGTGRPLSGGGETRRLEGWAVGNEGILEVRHGHNGAPATLWQLGSAARQIATLRVPDRANPAVTPNGDTIVPQAIEDESDLLLISLER